MQRTLAESAPEIFVEIHGAGMERKAATSAGVAELLLGAGYGIVHVETGERILEPAASPPEGHLFAAVAHEAPSGKPS
jgi:hypothetical protein